MSKLKTLILLAILLISPITMGVVNYHQPLSILELAKMTEIESNPVSKRMGIDWSKLTDKQRVIYSLLSYDSVFRANSIHPMLGVAQAIVEQGWELNTATNRIYNISWSVSSEYANGYELVWDNGKWVKYRTYATLKDAVQDYCNMLNSDSRYCSVIETYSHGLEAQVKAMAYSDYAQMGNESYEKLLLDVVLSIEKRLI